MEEPGYESSRVFVRQGTAYKILSGIVSAEMCIGGGSEHGE